MSNECCAGRSEFFLRAEPERSEGGWSEVQPNGEGVASGSATPMFRYKFLYSKKIILANKKMSSTGRFKL